MSRAANFFGRTLLNFPFPGIATFLLTLLFARTSPAQFPPAPGTGTGLAETVEAIDNARVITRILYITAHPDDESAAVLTYLSRGLHANVALLSLTRGEGGQNALGPEQAPQLGWIRTQELLAATRGYGVRLFFTRAKDFGFSKTAEETEKVWGDQVMEDMVRVIRRFHPDIVINNFGRVHSGHGHHQAAGLLTPMAVNLAADSAYKLPNDPRRDSAPGVTTPDDFDTEGPWGGKNHPVQILDVDRSGGSTGNAYQLPLDEISPLWGKTWREIGIDAFANHRTQGISAFLGSAFLRRPIALVAESGEKIDAKSLMRPLRALGGDGTSDECPAAAFFCAQLKQAEAHLVKAREEALTLLWDKASEDVAAAAKEIISLYPEGSHAAQWNNGPLLAEFRSAQHRMDRALALAAGLEIVAQSDRSEIVAGEPFTVDAEARCRKEAACELGKLEMVLPANANATAHDTDASKTHKFSVVVDGTMPAPTAWEQQQAEPAALVAAQQELTVAGYSLTARQLVTHVAATSTHIHRIALRMVPAYTLAVDPEQAIELVAKAKKPFDVLLRVHSYSSKPGRVEVSLATPAGWTSSAAQSLQFASAGDQYAKLSVSPPKDLPAGTYSVTAVAKAGDAQFTASLTPFPSMPSLLWSQPAQVRVDVFDATVPDNLRVGYISAESEPVPQALERLGIQVEMLDAAALAFSNLSRFDAIVVGVRAYELRPELPSANQRLLDYISNGGTLLVQYQRDFAWDKFQYAPYPAKINSDQPKSPLPRITDENAAVKFLKPDDPLLNNPNKITQKDFAGWTQERGLYFWSQFDGKYTPLFAMNDPGEAELNGGLVYTHLGKGTYIYTGLAFFRQLPEGVAGAYRLFVNLVSASRTAAGSSGAHTAAKRGAKRYLDCGQRHAKEIRRAIL